MIVNLFLRNKYFLPSFLPPNTAHHTKEIRESIPSISLSYINKETKKIPYHDTEKKIDERAKTVQT